MQYNCTKTNIIYIYEPSWVAICNSFPVFDPFFVRVMMKTNTAQVNAKSVVMTLNSIANILHAECINAASAMFWREREVTISINKL